MLRGSQNKGARSSCYDGLLESSSASTSVLQKVTSTPTGSLSETSATAVRQGIPSDLRGQNGGNEFIGRNGTARFMCSGAYLDIAASRTDQVRAHSALHSRGNWGSTAALDGRVTPQKLC